MTATFGRLVGKRRAFYPVVAGIIIYTLLVGADASVIRAAIMGLLVALANYLNRRSLALVSLFVAGLVMTALNPLTLWDVGFQLSFLATLSLVLFATPMTERFERLMNRLLPARAAKPVHRLPQRRPDRHPGRANPDPAADRALLRPPVGRVAAGQPAGAAGPARRHDLGRRWRNLLSSLHLPRPAPLSTLLSPLIRLIMLIPWLPCTGPSQ